MKHDSEYFRYSAPRTRLTPMLFVEAHRPLHLLSPEIPGQSGDDLITTFRLVRRFLHNYEDRFQIRMCKTPERIGN